MSHRFRRLSIKPVLAVLATLLLSGGSAGENRILLPGVRELKIAAQIATARDGSVITIPPGSYGVIRLLNVRHNPAVEVRMAGVTVAGLYIRNSAGLNFVGGTIDPNDKSRVALDALSVENMVFRDMTAMRALRGFVVGRAKNIQLLNNSAHGLRSDGFNVAAVQHVLVSGNSCRDFSPIKGTYDVNGKLIKDGDHPDCIQSWSRRTEMANVDIIIRDNRMEGDFQGIFFGNHTAANGVDDGGYDRIQIMDNVVDVGAPNGITLMGARDSRVTGNRVSSLPGYRFPNGSAVRTLIRTDTSVRTVVCGNKVEDFPDSAPTKKCPRS